MTAPMTASQARKAVLARPFAYHAAAALIERDVATRYRSHERCHHIPGFPPIMNPTSADAEIQRPLRVMAGLTREWQRTGQITAAVNIGLHTARSILANLRDSGQIEHMLGEKGGDLWRAKQP